MSDPVLETMHDLQIGINNAMRIAVGCRLADKVSVEDLVHRTGIQTVNRMSAQSKLMLAWQGINVPGSPLDEFFPRVQSHSGSRARQRGDVCASSKTSVGQRNFPETAIRLWNSTPHESRIENKKNSAKSAFKKFVEGLPL